MQAHNELYMPSLVVEVVGVVDANLEEAKANAAKKFKVDVSKVQLEQDEDVLDTWFSSALLPFSVFEWPNN